MGIVSEETGYGKLQLIKKQLHEIGKRK